MAAQDSRHIKLAGIPMMNRCRVLEGYIPAADATIVTRLLDAGAEIIGKAVNGSWCFDAIELSIYPGESDKQAAFWREVRVGALCQAPTGTRDGNLRSETQG